VGVAGIGQELGEHVVAFHLGHAQQLGAQAPVQLVEYRGQVGALRRVYLGGPPRRHRELEVLGDRVVVGVEQVLQVPPRHAQGAHLLPFPRAGPEPVSAQ
jgi:hypothetical protein